MEAVPARRDFTRKGKRSARLRDTVPNSKARVREGVPNQTKGIIDASRRVNS
jgi:hypothetical protein